MRLGIFGGSFDPVHCGHLQLARCCAEQAHLDQVWFVPTARQPLKPDGPHASDADRIEMLRLALAEHQDYRISEIEIQRGGVSYTADTLRTIKQQQPEAELFFLMGADSLTDLSQWHKPQEICRLSTLLVVRRAGTPEPDFDVLTKLLSAEQLQRTQGTQVEMPKVPTSSSQIRKLIVDGGDWRSLVPEVVARYIDEQRLYADSRR